LKYISFAYSELGIGIAVYRIVGTDGFGEEEERKEVKDWLWGQSKARGEGLALGVAAVGTNWLV
jgi:hypothetical protein